MILDQADIYTNIISPLLELATQDQTISIKRVIAIVIGKEYALKKYTKFMLNTGCSAKTFNISQNSTCFELILLLSELLPTKNATFAT